jgi:hypothetical protein
MENARAGLEMHFVFSYQTPAFTTLSLLGRLALSVLALVTLLWYSLALYRVHKRALPEQHWVRGGLLLLLLFQDPILFLRYVMGSKLGWDMTSHSLLSPHAAFVASLLLHYAAVLGLFVFWAMMVGESKRRVIEPPWLQFTSECQRF